MNFKVSGGNKNAEIKLNENRVGDILFLTVNMTMQKPEIPQPFLIEWNFNASDCYSTWNPGLLDIHGLAFEWSKLTMQSRLASWMPVQQLISKNGKNKLCIAVSDVDTPISIRTGIFEEDATFVCEIESLPSMANEENVATIDRWNSRIGTISVSRNAFATKALISF